MFSYSRRALSLVWTTNRALSIALGVLTVVAGVLPAGVAFVGARIVDAVIHAAALHRDSGVTDLAPVYRYVVFEALLVAASAVAQRGISLSQSLLRAQLGQRVNVMILEKALTLDLTQFEDSEFYDKLTRARREASSRPLSLVMRTFALLQNAVSLISFGGLLIHFSPWAVLLLVLAGLPAFVAEAKFSGEAFRLFRWRAPESRMQIYLEAVLAREDYAKEVKLFELGKRFLQRYRDIFQRLYREDRDLTLRRDAWGFGLGLLGTGALYGGYAWIAAAAVIGRMTVGQMTMYLMLFRQGQSAVSAALSAVGGLYEDNLYLSNLYEYLEQPVAAATGDRLAGPAPGDGIRFEEVEFTYPGATQPALSAVNLHVRPGESLALVGENGSGKTTLIKLLTRLYAPTRGRILLDGLDLRDWDESTLRQRIGVIFQDFARYQMMVGENIGAGDERAFDDEDAVARRGRQGPRRRIRRTASRRLPDPARQVVQGWPRAVRRPVAEDRPGPRLHAQRCRHPHSRRTHRGHRCRRRSRGVRALPRAHPQPHRDRDLAPFFHRARRGPDPGAGGRPHRGARQPRGADGGRRTVCETILPAGAGLPLASPRGPRRCAR